MSKVIEIIKKLNNLISLKPATRDEVEDVEIDLALPLAEDYKEYLLTFGAIIADDVELTGLQNPRTEMWFKLPKESGL